MDQHGLLALVLAAALALIAQQPARGARRVRIDLSAVASTAQLVAVGHAADQASADAASGYLRSFVAMVALAAGNE